MKEIEINRQPVELYKVLKFAGLAASGGEAKMRVADGQVRVNGMAETRKRRQLQSGDEIELDGTCYRLVIRGK